MDIKIIHDFNELSPYRDRWNSILSNSSNNNVFLTYEWMSTWWEVYGSHKQLFVLLVEEEGNPVGIVPMYSEERNFLGVLPIRQYAFLANRYVGSDFLDFIIDPGKEKEVLTKVLEYFTSHRIWDRIVFEDIDSESPTLGFLLSCLERSHLSFQQNVSFMCPYMILPDEWEAFMNTPDLVFKKSIQRYVKKLYRQRQINLELAVEESRLDESLKNLFKLHKERWNLSGSSGIFEDKNIKEFYHKISRVLSRRGWLRLSALQVDSKIEAMEFGIIYSHKYYYLQSGCSQAGLRMKAGNVLRYKVFESLIGNTKIIHFMRGAEPYKFDWGCLNKLTVNMELFRGFKGRLILLIGTLLENIKELARVLLSRKISRIR